MDSNDEVGSVNRDCVNVGIEEARAVMPYRTELKQLPAPGSSKFELFKFNSFRKGKERKNLKILEIWQALNSNRTSDSCLV
eukprot:09900_5